MKTGRWMLVMLALVIFGCATTATFAEFVSEEGGFSVSMPGEPEETTQTVPTDAGDIDVHMFSVESGDTAYLVGYSDYPAELVESVDVEFLLDSARDGAVGDGTLVDEVARDIDGNPGRELTVQPTEEGMMVYARIYMVGNRLYQVVVSTGDDGLTEDHTKFLDSFKLVSD